MPGFEFRLQRRAAGQQTHPEGEALAEADRDRENSSPVPGFARYEADNDSVFLSFRNAGEESQNSFLSIGQIESSIWDKLYVVLKQIQILGCIFTLQLIN